MKPTKGKVKEVGCDLCEKYEEPEDRRKPEFCCDNCHADCCEKHFAKDNCTDCGDD